MEAHRTRLSLELSPIEAALMVEVEGAQLHLSCSRWIGLHDGGVSSSVTTMDYNTDRIIKRNFLKENHSSIYGSLNLFITLIRVLPR